MVNEEREEQEDARAAALLDKLPETGPGAAIRVRTRLERSAAVTVRRGGRGLLLAAGGLALAAVALFAVLPEEAPQPAPVEAAVVDVKLAAETGWTTHTPLPGVELSFDGTGQLEGTAASPRIRWDKGTLHVEVVPDRGIQLAVVTREAEVRVIGTGFTVTRSALGTRVEVRHGIVEVGCGDEAPARLLAGQDLTCFPRSAAAMLGRARAQQDAGAPAAEVLETLERGLVLAQGQASVRDELSASRVRSLVDLGQRVAALEAARTYLAEPGGLRRAEIVRLAADTALAEGGCAAAAPWLLEAGPEAVAECRR